ncbi:MAG: response regulator, partial [Verrucomicrobiota bacterium]
MNEPRILIVEDDEIVAAVVSERLKQLGYQPAGLAVSGDQAIALAGELRPDLVLMDIRLEGEMDGISAAQEIRQRFHIPSVFLSAYSEEATIERAKLAEPFGYILKPFEGREVRANIEMALYKHRMEEDLREKEASYHTLADSGMALIWTSGTDKKCDYFNLPWLKFTGRTLEQQLGDGWAEGVHPDDLARGFKIYTEAFDRRESFSMD